MKQLIAFVALGLALVGRTWAAEGPGPVVVRDCSVLDVAKGMMLPRRTVVLAGGLIRAIGTPEAPVEEPAGASTIEARGKYLIPGLIDAHVHLVQVLASAHVTGDEVLPLFLAAGVTSVRDVGDEVVPETLVARFAAAHPESCPRVFTCSPLIDKDPPFHDYESPAMIFGRALTDPAKVPGFVEDVAAWGVTSLKIYVGTPRPIGRLVIAEGHRRGLKVIGHLGAYSAQDAVADGIDGLEHIWGVWDFIIPPEERSRPDSRSTLDLHNPTAKALIAELARRGTTVDPTLVVFRNMLLLNDRPEVRDHPDNAVAPARLLRFWEEDVKRIGLRPETLLARRGEFAKYRELTGVLHRAGVTLLAGTDAPEPYCPPGRSLHQELELLVESGLPPAAAIRCATLNNAEALGQAHRLGSVEPGKAADLILLDADPLDRIANTRAIAKVFHGGVAVDRAAILKLVPKE
ncbi:amidohydrolase family protein [Paludisphaera mucosa]|uniref:Amidohydrolase family protein n=1 Tax=Paludisphaera mucosa TaxID=3030827 RepID=A0ABT6FCY9_9BACT|nr:amidohydrolase family protein [Paludisphaera mucosa]MDG3005436.1 amidohydrolase family protein [Paludisphaera mucosa]